MWFIAIILGLVISVSEVDLFVGISNLTRSLHSQCLNFTPESLNKEIYSALICGNKLSSSDFSQNLKNLGIYHVIIVSGSHLIFLSILVEKIFSSTRFRKWKFITLPLLSLYALTTGAEPPVVRALLGLIIDSYQKRNKLFWSQNEVIFISVLISLALFDPWKRSYSLILSYVASVSLSLSKEKNPIHKNLKIYILILPFLLPLSAPHPLSFISNMTLSPLIAVILFPLSFLSFLLPYFHLLVDPLWNAFLKVCAYAGPELPSLNKVSLSISYLWSFVLILNFYGIYKEKRENHVVS